MAELTWDQVGERVYETGVDRGVLYLPDNTGVYSDGYAWNGLTGVTESPSGAESTPQYADNIKYLNLVSSEEFGATIEAFTYPDEFAQCDGTAAPSAGLYLGQQGRRSFGLAYRTRIGNDVDGADHGYKLHLIYGALAAPSERAYATINDSPEALTFSWELSTTAVDVPGTNPLTSKPYKPTASITIDSTKVTAARLAQLEDALYGTASTSPRLPLPDEVISIVSTPLTVVTTVRPTYDSTTDVVGIPNVTGVRYFIGGTQVTGNVTITQDTLVTAEPAQGYTFSATSETDWFIDYV